jgi:hypothetical protein
MEPLKMWIDAAGSRIRRARSMPRPHPVRRSLLGVVIGLLALATAGRAQGDEESAAGRLFQEGRALMVEGRFAEACPKLEESQRLEPTGGTQLNVAVCHERLGKIATAWVEFNDALVTARTEGRPEREKFAQGRLAALEPRLPWLLVRVAPEVDASDLTIAIDGATIPAIAWGKEMPIDPGEHRVTATAGGQLLLETTVALKESAHETVTVSAGAAADASEPPAPPVPEEKPAKAPARARPRARARTPSAPVHLAGRFVYEVGAFAGFLTGSMDRAEITDDPETARFTVQTLEGNAQVESCASVSCSYRLPDRGGFVTGPTAFVGYALTERVHVGLRSILGLRAGGGALFTIGPSASAHVLGPIWAGGSLLLGTASQSGRGYVLPEEPTYDDLYDRDFRMSASLGAALGASAEIGVTVLERPTGSLMIQATGLFLSGNNGSAFALPLSVVYRWY